MGSIHKGHESLIKKSKKECQHTIVSIYTKHNPTLTDKLKKHKKIASGTFNLPQTIDRLSTTTYFHNYLSTS